MINLDFEIRKKEFVDYVLSFYGNADYDAIYPMNVSKKDAAKAINKYLKMLNDSDHQIFTNYGADSLDRERVRDILIDDYEYEWVI